MLAFPKLRGQRALIVALAAAAALANSAHAQMGLGLTPMRLDLNLVPGAVQSGVLTIANHGGAVVRVSADILDFYLDATATPQFAREFKQESEFSCRSWLVANPMEAELNNGTQFPVRYTVRVPQSATARSYHCAIGFTTQPTAADLKTMGLRTAVQIVAAIYVVVGKPAVEGTIKDLKLQYVPDPKTPEWTAVVTFSNPGLMHYRPVGSLEVLDESGAVIETTPFTPLPVLPKREQNFVFPLKLTHGEGRYTLRARVDLGGNEIQEATASVVATKPKP